MKFEPLNSEPDIAHWSCIYREELEAMVIDNNVVSCDAVWQIRLVKNILGICKY